MSMRSAKLIDGELIFSKIHGLKPPYNSSTHKYDYHGEDLVFEAHRKRENWAAFRVIIRELRNMEQYAQNGFRDLSSYKQGEEMWNRRKQATDILGQGSFLPHERKHYIGKINKKIYKIHRPFIKRKKTIKRLFT